MRKVMRAVLYFSKVTLCPILVITALLIYGVFSLLRISKGTWALSILKCPKHLPRLIYLVIIFYSNWGTFPLLNLNIKII